MMNTFPAEYHNLVAGRKLTDGDFEPAMTEILRFGDQGMFLPAETVDPVASRYIQNVERLGAEAVRFKVGLWIPNARVAVAQIAMLSVDARPKRPMAEVRTRR